MRVSHDSDLRSSALRRCDVLIGELTIGPIAAQLIQSPPAADEMLWKASYSGVDGPGNKLVLFAAISLLELVGLAPSEHGAIPSHLSAAHALRYVQREAVQTSRCLLPFY
jgi:hypothetical protein